MKDTLKYRIIEAVVQSEDELVLEEIENLLNLSKDDFFPELPDEVKERINIAEQEIEEGKGILHENVMREVHEKYLKKE